MSWHDDLEEALMGMSVSTFKSTAVCESYYENYEDPNYWEEEHEGKKPKPTEIRNEAIGCMLCNLHDMGGSERSHDLARMVKDLASKYEIACRTLKDYQKKIKKVKIDK
jgi:hypothetical protein